MSKNNPSLTLLPPTLLMVAHLMTVIALVSFGTRTGDYPLHTTGLMIYVVATALTMVGLTVQTRRTEPVRLPTALLLVSAPALVSLVFRAGLWMTPFLGGAPYAPYDPGDSDIVMLFGLFFATLFSVASILYSSVSYLVVACTVQIALYFGTHAFPHRLLYPSADFLGVRPSTFAALMGIYGVGAILLLLRVTLFGQRKPGLWIATTLTGLAGGWILYETLTWLPGNGAYLGYIAADTYVPAQAWDWTRPVAQCMVITAIVVAGLSDLLALLQSRIVNRQPFA